MTAIYNSTRSGSAPGDSERPKEGARPSDSRSGATGQFRSSTTTKEHASVSKIISRDGMLIIVEERRKDAA